jgi:glycosyltransferase involved in cell wall biosynthesis
MVDQNTDFFQITDNFKEHSHTLSYPIIKSPLTLRPQITIAITAYKRPDLLKISLESVIYQEGKYEYEILVVDDDPCRGTETEELMKHYDQKNITYYKNAENLGLFGNWNRCLELAKGEFVTILNDDDWLDRNYINIVGNFLKVKTETELLMVGFTVMRDGKIAYETPIPKGNKINRVQFIEFLYGNINPGSLGILFKTETARKIGGFNNLFFPTSDVIFLVNYLSAIKHSFRLPNRLAYSRISVNESLKTSVQVSNILYDKLLRNQLIKKMPSLSWIVKTALPVFEYDHFLRVCKYSEEFNSLYSGQKEILRQKVKFVNKIAYKILLHIKRQMLKRSELYLLSK